MKVVCINNNGWHCYRGNYYAFVIPGKQSEIAGPKYSSLYTVISSFVDIWGDLCYIVDGYGIHGWEADCFVIIENSTADQLIEQVNQLQNETI